MGRREATTRPPGSRQETECAEGSGLAARSDAWPESVTPLEVVEALRGSEARLHALLSSLDDLVFELDRDGNYLGVWTSRDDLLVAPREDLCGRNIRDFIGDALCEELVGRIRHSLETGAPEIMEYALDVVAGSRWFEGRMAPIASVGRPISVCFLSRDITATRLVEQARDDAEAQLRHLALHDGLTGLPNRTCFREQLERDLARYGRQGEQLAVLMLDLDRFKEINDALGHAAGDVVLREVASRLTTVTREGDMIARLGGDEFALLLPNAGNDEAAGVAARVAATVEDSIDVDNVLLHVDISTGIAVCPRDGLDADSLLRRADVAMYAAKRRNSGFTPYDISLDRCEPEQLALVGELRGALERGELVPYFQPLLRLSDGSVPKAEALVRWHHPQRGLIPPARFMPLVQETAIATTLTRYMLERTLAQCRSWLRSGRFLGVALNLTMRDLMDVGFPDDVAGLLRAHDVPAWLLSLEITEQSVMVDTRRTTAILDRLAGMGVHLAVDDFGTGYSSLTYLVQLPVNEIKVDRSFVTRMATVPEDEVIVRAAIELARNLDKQVVAEGVETEEVLLRLAELGCDCAQGYHISRAVPPDELERWLSKR